MAGPGCGGGKINAKGFKDCEESVLKRVTSTDGNARTMAKGTSKSKGNQSTKGFCRTEGW